VRNHIRQQPLGWNCLCRRTLICGASRWCSGPWRGDPAEKILATATQVDADLIVMAVTHSRALADHASWSIASKVVRQSECPVLTVRDRL
jgi:hypothetical protein